MDKNLQSVADTIQQDPNMTDEQKKSVLKSLNAVDKELQILSFKLDRTEKVKRTTAILLEETIEELEQKRKAIEEALSELKATQDQLVQQEKLASLGQLTAGIAHEIKNPLNFVNNFSELSLELIEEIREEILSEKAKVKSEKSPFEGGMGGEAGQGDDTKPSNASNLSTILDILDDIEANLRKIHEHGSRADGIVKSMLQHSRGGSGEPEPTDLNALISEYVNLAFHGMRAGKEPISVDIDLQLDENVGEIPIVAEDFSRVVVNLCNNAFDAMREKEKLTPRQQSGRQQSGRQLSAEPNKKYVPKLVVRTSRNDHLVTIAIEDNGPGIPDEIRDKILQPFFTTKKGKEGTGLGLSITNDIINAHGGRLEILSEKGRFTNFMITLKTK